MTNTNWTIPKKNIFAAMNDLRKALAAGENARLIKARNEDCAHPIKQKNSITDFRAYEFSIGLMKTRKSIAEDERMPAFEKYLTLNYRNCFGTETAVKRYYEKGLLSSDNFKGVGRSHLVAVKDLVRFHACHPEQKDKDYAKMFEDQYFNESTGDETHFFDHYRLKSEHSIYTITRFKRKLWVVELLRADKPKAKIPWMQRLLLGTIKTLVYPFKYVPKKSVLKMDNYKVITFRVGAVTNGFSIDIQVPKKFSFN